MSPIALIGAGVLLFACGLGLGFWFAGNQRNRETTRADGLQKELDDYRRDVTEHFSRTAEHFQTIGQQYRSLYKHMAHGADTLCDASQPGVLPAFPSDTSLISPDAAEQTEAPAPEEIFAEEISTADASEENSVEEAVTDVQASEDIDAAEPTVAEEIPPVKDFAPEDILADEVLAEPVAPQPEEKEDRTVH